MGSPRRFGSAAKCADAFAYMPEYPNSMHGEAEDAFVIPFLHLADFMCGPPGAREMPARRGAESSVRGSRRPASGCCWWYVAEFSGRNGLAHRDGGCCDGSRSARRHLLS